MNDKKTYTEEELDTAIKITNINSNINSLMSIVNDLKKSFEILPKITQDISEVYTLAIATKSLTDGLLIRVVAIETNGKSTEDQNKGRHSIWKSYLAIIGAMGLTATAILGILSVYQLVHR